MLLRKTQSCLGLLLVLVSLASLPVEGQSPSRIRPDVGSVEGDVYRNDVLGFCFRYPAGWRVRHLATGAWEPDRETGRDVYRLVMFQHPTFPRPTGQIDIRAVDLSAGPLRGKELELPDEAPHERNKDLKRKRGPSPVKLAGREFTRADFQMRFRGVTVYYEAKFTTLVAQHALVFTLIADNEALFKELLEAMEGLAFDGFPP